MLPYLKPAAEEYNIEQIEPQPAVQLQRSDNDDGSDEDEEKQQRHKGVGQR